MLNLYNFIVSGLPKVEAFVLVPRVSVGLFANRPVPVPKEGALVVVVVPNPAGLLPKRFCEIKSKLIIYKNNVKTMQKIKIKIKKR